MGRDLIDGCFTGEFKVFAPSGAVEISGESGPVELLRNRLESFVEYRIVFSTAQRSFRVAERNQQSHKLETARPISFV